MTVALKPIIYLPYSAPPPNSLGKKKDKDNSTAEKSLERAEYSSSIEKSVYLPQLTGYIFLNQNPIYESEASIVRPVREISTGEVCAAKLSLGKQGLADKEIEILKSLRKTAHAIQLRAYGYVTKAIYSLNEPTASIITDLVPCDNLLKNKGNFTFEQICTILKQSLELLLSMHENNIAHGDLKPENMLFNFNTNHLTIIDMGLSKNYNKDPKENGAFGTLDYIAPELFLGRGQYDTSIDIWSLAAVVFELVTGEYLIRGFTDQMPPIYMLYCIITEIGMPPNDFLEPLEYTNLFLEKDKNNNYSCKVTFPKPSCSWQKGMRLAAIKRKYPKFSVEALIDLMNQMLSYNNRITAKHALDHKIFNLDIRFKVRIANLSNLPSYQLQLVHKVDKYVKKHLVINLSCSPVTLQCLHIPTKKGYTLRIKHNQFLILEKYFSIPPNSEILIENDLSKGKISCEVIKPKVGISKQLED